MLGLRLPFHLMSLFRCVQWLPPHYEDGSCLSIIFFFYLSLYLLYFSAHWLIWRAPLCPWRATFHKRYICSFGWFCCCLFKYHLFTCPVLNDFLNAFHQFPPIGSCVHETMSTGRCKGEQMLPSCEGKEKGDYIHSGFET